jgi:hypothetical protein
MTDILTIDAILDAFSAGTRVLPRIALEQAVARWPEVSPALLAILNGVAEGGPVTERTDRILFLSIYLMAQVRETRAYRPLCAIAATGELASDLIGDGVTEDLSIILARVYDGELAPLQSLIEDTGADEFARDAAFNALAWLTATGQIDRDKTAGYLRDLHTRLQPQETNWIWVGWQQAIANLGLEDLVPLVEDAFARGLIEDIALSLDDFREDLSAALQASDPTGAFRPSDRDDGHLDDIVSHLSGWVAYQQATPLSRPPAPPPSACPVRNPYRDVGRNDPCPCGSGKKFKKCCLDVVR